MLNAVTRNGHYWGTDLLSQNLGLTAHRVYMPILYQFTKPLPDSQQKAWEWVRLGPGFMVSRLDYVWNVAQPFSRHTFSFIISRLCVYLLRVCCCRGLTYFGIACLILACICLIVGVLFCVALRIAYQRINGRPDEKLVSEIMDDVFLVRDPHSSLWSSRVVTSFSTSYHLAWSAAGRSVSMLHLIVKLVFCFELGLKELILTTMGSCGNR